MGSLRKTVLIGSLAWVMPAVAMAADLYTPPPYEYPPPPVEIGSNWYLRGDVGYKLYRGVNAQFNNINYTQPGLNDMIDETLSNTGVVGVGFGYRFGPHFRMDATVDYEWPGHFRGRLPCIGCAAAGQYSTETADISAWTGLVNAYFDLGTFRRLTPYVGGGVGASLLQTTNVAFTNPDGSTGTNPGGSRVNFAWALMAGASWDVSDRWALDFGYRYLNLGSAQSGIITAPPPGDTPITYNNIAAHEFRVGVRYSIR